MAAGGNATKGNLERRAGISNWAFAFCMGRGPRADAARRGLKKKGKRMVDRMLASDRDY